MYSRSALLFCLMLLLAPMSFGETPLRIGWQIPWATQGQLVQILKKTDILKKNGLTAEFIGRDYGPLLNELALAGSVDVIFTADQPAATLFSKSKDWRGVARLMYNRTVVYVPKSSPLKSVKDLKGKTIGVPVGAAAERTLNELLSENGIDPKKQVKIVNIGVREQVALVHGALKDGRWDNIDALSGFDPTPAIFEAKDIIRVLEVKKVVSMALMSRPVLEKDPLAAKKLASALADAYAFFRVNRQLANKWFLDEAKLRDGSDRACDIASSVEPNLSVAKSDQIRVRFNSDDFAEMQKAAEFVAAGVGKEIKMTEFVSNEFLDRAEKR